MTRRDCLRFALPAVLLAGCEERERLMLAGATLIDGTGSEPRAGCLVAIRGEKIQSIDSAGGEPLPPGAVDLRGKYLMPSPVDLNVAGTRRIDPVYTVTGFERALRVEEKVIFGVPAEGSVVPADLLETLRQRRVIVAPMLAQLTNEVQAGFGGANAKMMVETGISIGVASMERTDAGLVAEMQRMRAAGIEPMDVLVAATRTGARAIGATGTLEPGAPADLIVVPGNPLADPVVLNRVERRMQRGAWT